MAKHTIRDAITRVRPLSSRDIYEEIMSRNLYEFKTKDTLNIVRSQLRRHCRNIERPAIADAQVFKITDSGLFKISDE